MNGFGELQCQLALFRKGYVCQFCHLVLLFAAKVLQIPHLQKWVQFGRLVVDLRGSIPVVSLFSMLNVNELVAFFALSACICKKWCTFAPANGKEYDYIITI